MDGKEGFTPSDKEIANSGRVWKQKSLTGVIGNPKI
jgi:hypothetical protein